MTVFGVDGLCATRGGRVVVRDVDLCVEQGEVVALAGPNGSGKTTVLAALAGSEPLGGGKLTLDGHPIAAGTVAHWTLVHGVLADAGWLPGLTVLDHLALASDRDRALQHLDLLGVAALADRLPTSLSAGERQRVRLADASARAWRVLLLDEPERHLDAAGRELLHGLLQRARRRGPVVVATHDASVLAAADRVLELR